MGGSNLRLSRQAGCVQQDKLSASTIGLVGSGYLADFMRLTLQGLGVGRIEHEVAEEQGFLECLAQGESPLAFAERMQFEQEYVMGKPSSELVINVGGAPYGHEALYPVGTRIAYGRGSLGCSDGLRAIEAGVFAGILGQSVVHYCESKEILPGEMVAPRGIPGAYKALIVGAGATGTYVGLQAALNGFSSLTIMDADRVEAHNLNRQVLYYDAIGLFKAQTLCDRLSLFGVDTRAIPEMLTEESVLDSYDVIFSCVDRLEPRRILDEYAARTDTLLVDGGTSVYSARVLSTAKHPIHSQIDISRQDPVIKPGCSEKFSPSIIMPNMIAGSYMVDEALAVLGGAEGRVIRYDAYENRVAYG